MGRTKSEFHCPCSLMLDLKKIVEIEVACAHQMMTRAAREVMSWVARAALEEPREN